MTLLTWNGSSRLLVETPALDSDDTTAFMVDDSASRIPIKVLMSEARFSWSAAKQDRKNDTKPLASLAENCAVS